MGRENRFIVSDTGQIDLRHKERLLPKLLKLFVYFFQNPNMSQHHRLGDEFSELGLSLESQYYCCLNSTKNTTTGCFIWPFVLKTTEPFNERIKYVALNRRKRGRLKSINRMNDYNKMLTLKRNRK